MTSYITAIHRASHYSENLIKQTLKMGKRGIEPLNVPGTIQFTVWMMYRAIREYERTTDDKTD